MDTRPETKSCTNPACTQTNPQPLGCFGWTSANGYRYRRGRCKACEAAHRAAYHQQHKNGVIYRARRQAASRNYYHRHKHNPDYALALETARNEREAIKRGEVI